MSRNHLQFVRDAGSGNGEDWRQISWLVVDLNGMCGTFINLNKIEANKSRVLNNGDLVGVGCPDQESSKSEAIEKFVFKIRAPEAYRVAPLTTVKLADDCPTPPPQHEEEDVEMLNSVNLPDVVPEDKSSHENSEAFGIAHKQPVAQVPTASVLSEPRKEVFIGHGASDEGSPVIFSSRKRRLKRLLSSSEEGDDEARGIKNLAKKIKSKPETELVNSHECKKISINVQVLKLPKRAVSAKVGPMDKIVEWTTLSSMEYKRMARMWAGLDPDGSQGTPLFQALEPDVTEDDGLSDVSSGEMLGLSDLSREDGEIQNSEKEPIDMDLSSISSGDEDVKVTGESHSTDSDLVKITYGVDKNSKPIIVKAELQNHRVNYSMNDDAAVITLLDSDEEEAYNQSQNLLLDDTSDSNSDRNSPLNLRDQEDGYPLMNLNDREDGEVSDTVDSDSEQDDDEIQILNESQTSLYKRIFDKVVVKPEPSDAAMEKIDDEVDNIRKELLQSLNAEPKSPSLLDGPDNSVDIEKLTEPDNMAAHADQGAAEAVVIQEHDNLLIMKLAIKHKVGQRLVKLAFLHLKGGDMDSVVLEPDLDNYVFLRKHHNLLKETEKEFNYSENKLNDALFKLRERNTEISKESLVSELLDQEEESIKQANKLEGLSAKKKSLPKKTDGPQRLADVLRAPDEKAKEVLKNVSSDINRTGAAILDTLEDDVPLEFKQSRSPDRTGDESDDSIDDLLKDDDEDNSKSKETRSEAIPGPIKSSPVLADRGPQIIAPPHIPVGRGHFRGVSAESIQTPKDLFKKNESSRKAVKTADLTRGKDDQTVKKFAQSSLSSEELKVKRQEKLKQLSEAKERKVDASRAPSSSGVGVMKTSMPKAQKLLLEMQQSGTHIPKRRSDNTRELSSKPRERKTSVAEASMDNIREISSKPRERKTSVSEASIDNIREISSKTRERKTSVSEVSSDNTKDSSSTPGERRISVSETSTPGRTRKPSGNFLAAEEAADLDKKEKAKREKYAFTGDGYKAVKKMSVHNVDYNIMSQDISKMPIKAKPLKFSGMFSEPPKELTKKIKKKVRWRDETGMEPLTDTKYIEPHNKGLKCGPGNKDLMTPISVGREGNKRKHNKDIDMSNVFKGILEWNCAWPKEQKKSQNKEPPPAEGSYKLLPLPSSFSNLPEYQQIFLPLMFHELYSSVFEDYDENADSVPVCVQEVTRDTTQLFTIIRCISLLTDQVI